MNIRDIALTDMRSCGIDTSVFLWETDLIEYVNSAREILGMDLLRKFNGCILNGGYHPKKEQKMKNNSSVDMIPRLTELVEKKDRYIKFNGATLCLQQKHASPNKDSIMFDIRIPGKKREFPATGLFLIGEHSDSERELNKRSVQQAIEMLNKKASEIFTVQESSYKKRTEMPERIIDVAQLKKGDQIFTIQDGRVEIIEFREIHPYYNGYSLFMNSNKDGMSKFWNENLTRYEYYRYSGDNATWLFIYHKEIEYHQNWINSIKERINKVYGKAQM